MKIRISDLPNNGLKINDIIQLEALNQRMSEGRNNDIVFVQAPQVSMMVIPSPLGGQTHGTVKARYLQPCSRCYEGLERDIEVDLDFVLLRRTPENTKPRKSEDDESEEEIEDIGIIYVDGDDVDLEPFIQENLILALSAFWHPPTDKKGNCEVCKIDVATCIGRKESEPSKPEAVSLADLFKKAGLKN